MEKRRLAPLPPHSSVLELLRLVSGLLAIALTCQSCFYPPLFARFQIEGMTLDFLDDVFLLNLALEATQCVFKRFPFLKSYFSQLANTPVSV